MPHKNTAGGDVMNIEFLHTKKTVLIFFVIGLMTALVIWFCLVRHVSAVQTTDYTGMQYEEVGTKYLGYIDQKDYKVMSGTTDHRVKIRGWLVPSGEEIESVSMHVVLKNTTTSQWFTLPTTIEVRTDVTEHFDDGNRYDYCGFSATTLSQNIEAEKYDFEIYVLCTINDKTSLVKFADTLKSGGTSNE